MYMDIVFIDWQFELECNDYSFQNTIHEIILETNIGIIPFNYFLQV
jgi:hypothetical protein